MATRFSKEEMDLSEGIVSLLSFIFDESRKNEEFPSKAKMAEELYELIRLNESRISIFSVQPCSVVPDQLTETFILNGGDQN